jgi:4-amino-4-deoxychorismate lyase
MSLSYHKYYKRKVEKVKLIEAPDILYDKKYADRSGLEYLFEQKQHCDDVLIVQAGLVTDTTIANVAFLQEGKWYTPKKPLLQGTTRERLLRESRLFERDIAYDTLKNYEAMALMNAMIEFDIIKDKKIEDIIC